MKIKYKLGNKIIIVDVKNDNCKKYKCFSPHKYTHQQRTIDGKPNNWTDRHYSCSYRNYHGCPDKPKIKG